MTRANQPSDSPPLVVQRAGGCLLSVFCIFWIAFLIFFDVLIVHSSLKAHRARGYASTTAQVTESRVVRSTGRNTSESPRVVYRYTVGETEYQHDRVSYFLNAGGKHSARAFVSAHPPGHDLTVYYDPGNPQDAVLRVGLDDFPTLLPIFFLPFHCIGVGILLYAASVVRRRVGGEFRADLRNHLLVDRPDRAVVRLRPAYAQITFLGTLGLAGFIAVFVVGLPMGFTPPWAVVIVVLCGLILLACAATGFAVRFARRPLNTVRIDRLSGSVRVGDFQTNVAKVAGIAVRHEVVKPGRGDREQTVSTWLFRLTSGGEHALGQTEDDRKAAESAARVLRHALGLSGDPA